MIRNSVVNGPASRYIPSPLFLALKRSPHVTSRAFVFSPQQTTSTSTSSTPRDPRTNVSADPRSARADPRSRDTSDPRSAHAPLPPEVPDDMLYMQQQPDMMGFGAGSGQPRLQDEDLRIRPPLPQQPEVEKVTNCSLAYTGGVPYILRKITIDVLRPMLPKNIDPSSDSHSDDPRVQRYGRPGQPNAQPIRVRSKLGSLDTAPTSDASLNNGRSSLKTKPDDSMTSPTQDDVKAVLPEGLRRPPIPLPKLLDPQIGKQLSIESDRRKHDRGTPSKVTSPGSKPSTPFSHRNDPRFRKKIKSRSNSSGDGDAPQRQNSDDHASTSDADVTSDVHNDAKTDIDERVTSVSSNGDGVVTVTQSNTMTSADTSDDVSRPDSSVDYPTAPGFYADISGDDSYNPIYSNLMMGNRVDDDNSRSRSPPATTSSSQDKLSSAYTGLNLADTLYSSADSSEAPSYVPIKDMFKTIDPTASPFGSIS